ncbi:tagaturonate reductase [Flavobacterium sp. UMI-01]|uniref:tagaturonate reductase n=1 Tax=Flavobacterium sp. UMI-01 TaxID=1441053 RepID=UPI001C7E0E2F|nr:tagaturonate reductase [Flavobacterium sp. UMI-01]GIZ08892.1 altronate oxidoreductase [Flavobacterium sp. UMI-01]
MKKLNRKNTGLEKVNPIKIVQFGEGNFLRAFVNYAFQELNKKADFNAGIAVVQPIEQGMINMLNEQDGLYTLFIKGLVKGQEIQEKELITNIVKGINPYVNYEDYLALAKEESLEFVISNTTESGIAYVATDAPQMQPPLSFPAKLTVLLHERFKHFNGDSSKGLTIIPCELINHNSEALKEIILTYIDNWKLGDEFKNWILNHNSFHSTLVDRIVPGYPKDEIEAYNRELDYSDNLIVTAEKFFLWVIEGDDKLKAKLPFEKTDLDVKIVPDMQMYRTRKVRILNGVHTAMVPFSLMYGNETVKESVDGNFTGKFINEGIFKEIIETIDMDRAELEEFAEAVLDRFRNPFVKHMLASIALNSISKFKVRVLPSVLQYCKSQGKIPAHLTFAFACLIRFYKGEWNNITLPIQDSEDITTAFLKIWQAKTTEEVVRLTLSNTVFWDQDLSEMTGLTEALVLALNEIESKGVEKGFLQFTNAIKNSQTV